MSEIYTNIWVNIDKFNYLDPNKLRVAKRDVQVLERTRNNFFIKPGLCLMLTMLYSRYRNRIWGATKNYFLGSRVNSRRTCKILIDKLKL